MDTLTVGLLFLLIGVPLLFVVAGSLGVWLGGKIRIRSAAVRRLLMVFLLASLVVGPMVLYSAWSASLAVEATMVALWIFSVTSTWEAINKPFPHAAP